MAPESQTSSTINTLSSDFLGKYSSHSGKSLSAAIIGLKGLLNQWYFKVQEKPEPTCQLTLEISKYFAHGPF